MPVILARVDDRLIHGQVTEGWGASLDPDVILVVSDEIAGSSWQAEICLAALPSTLEGMISALADAPAIINRLVEDNRNAFVLFETPDDACIAIEHGAHIERLNIGGMHSVRGKREILDFLYVDDDDVTCLKRLDARGVFLDFRDLPDHDNFNVLNRL